MILDIVMPPTSFGQVCNDARCQLFRSQKKRPLKHLFTTTIVILNYNFSASRPVCHHYQSCTIYYIREIKLLSSMCTKYS